MTQRAAAHLHEMMDDKKHVLSRHAKSGVIKIVIGGRKRGGRQELAALEAISRPRD